MCSMKTLTKIMFQGKINKLYLVIYFVITVASGFLALYCADMMSNLFNNMLGNSQDGFAKSLLIVSFLYAFNYALGILSRFIVQRFAWDGCVNLFKYFMNKLLRADYNYHIKKEAADIEVVLNRSTQSVANFYEDIIRYSSGTIMFVFYSVLIYRINLYAFIFSCVLIPLYIFLTKGIGKNFMSIQYENMDIARNKQVVSLEALSSVSNIKAKNAYSFFVDRCLTFVRQSANKIVKFNVISVYLSSITGLISVIAPILIIFFSTLVSGSTIQAASIMILYIYIPSFFSGFTNIYSLFFAYKTNKAGLQNLIEMDSLPAEPIGSNEINTFESLSTCGVSVKFGDNHIVKVPDLNIVKGEKVIFFGESGIGKSTIFNIIMGFITDYEGLIKINGIDLKTINLDSLRKVFGIAAQSPKVYTLTLEANIMLGLEQSNAMPLIKLAKLENQSQVKEEQILNDKIMSGGEKSRLGLAQMLAREPSVLLMDETFSNVDEPMEKEILENLLKKYPHSTFICISHRLSNKHLFDRIIDFNVRV